jgi:uncharacterized protein
VFTSVIVFGPVRILDDRARKSWFFDQILAKYGEPGWSFEPGNPLLDRIVLYKQQVEIVQASTTKVYITDDSRIE